MHLIISCRKGRGELYKESRQGVYDYPFGDGKEQTENFFSSTKGLGKYIKRRLTRRAPLFDHLPALHLCQLSLRHPRQHLLTSLYSLALYSPHIIGAYSPLSLSLLHPSESRNRTFIFPTRTRATISLAPQQVCAVLVKPQVSLMRNILLSASYTHRKKEPPKSELSVGQSIFWFGMTQD